MQLYAPECIPLSHDTLENAIQWLWSLDRLAPVSSTACAESVLKAMMDVHVSLSVCLSLTLLIQKMCASTVILLLYMFLEDLSLKRKNIRWYLRVQLL